jgi:hypothetical protein
MNSPTLANSIVPMNSHALMNSIMPMNSHALMNGIMPMNNHALIGSTMMLGNPMLWNNQMMGGSPMMMNNMMVPPSYYTSSTVTSSTVTSSISNVAPNLVGGTVGLPINMPGLMSNAILPYQSNFQIPSFLSMFSSMSSSMPSSSSPSSSFSQPTLDGAQMKAELSLLSIIENPTDRESIEAHIGGLESMKRKNKGDEYYCEKLDQEIDFFTKSMDELAVFQPHAEDNNFSIADLVFNDFMYSEFSPEQMRVGVAIHSICMTVLMKTHSQSDTAKDVESILNIVENYREAAVEKMLNAAEDNGVEIDQNMLDYMLESTGNDLNYFPNNNLLGRRFNLILKAFYHCRKNNGCDENVVCLISKAIMGQSQGI